MVYDGLARVGRPDPVDAVIGRPDILAGMARSTRLDHSDADSVIALYCASTICSFCFSHSS